MRAHLGIRAHICEVCSKSFVERSHLVRHQRIHTNVRIPCPDCDYTTTRQDKLKEHLKKHHSGEVASKPKKATSTKKKKESKSSDNDADLETPMVVKWDHGCYSLSQGQQDGETQAAGDAILNGDGEYCVLRDPLSATAPIQHMLTVEQIDGQLTMTKSLDTSSIVTHNTGIIPVHADVTGLSQGQAVSGINTAVPVLSLLNSPMSSGDPTLVATKLTGSSDAAQHTYTIIEAASGQDNQQAEYAGLNAFMAFIE